MMSLSHFSRLKTKTQLLVAGAMLSCSVLLLGAHAMKVRHMQEIGLPAAVRLPAVLERVAMLKEQSEITELQAQLRGGSPEEAVQVFVLPRDGDLDRLLATFDVFFNYAQKQRLMRNASAIAVGETREEEGTTVMPLTFEADMTEQGLAELVLLMDLAGTVSVADAFDSAEISLLLALTEEENPAAITSLEQFLSTDLLRYAREPKPFEEQLFKSFASESFVLRWKEITNASRLTEFARMLGGETGLILDRQNLWPLRLLKIVRLDRRDLGNGMTHVFVEVEAYGRVD